MQWHSNQMGGWLAPPNFPNYHTQMCWCDSAYIIFHVTFIFSHVCPM